MKQPCKKCKERFNSLTKCGHCAYCFAEINKAWSEDFTDKSEAGLSNNKKLKDSGKIK